MSVTRRRLTLGLLGSAGLAGTPGRVLAQSPMEGPGGYPERPITLYCPWAPGGNTDIALRALAETTSKYLPKRLVVENKPGAGGALGAQTMAATAKPDGYTIAQAPLGVFRLPHMVKTSFDPLKDLAWVICNAGYNFGVSVRGDAPWKTWKDFIAFAKANPGKITYASPGIGTSLHLTMDDIANREGINWVQVPFKGTNESNMALRGGQVDAVAGSPNQQWVEAGTMRPLVTWSEKRLKWFPDIPTLNELYGIVANSPWGIVVPKATDARIVRYLHDVFKRGMDDPLFLKTLDQTGMEPYYLGSEQYAAWAVKTYAYEKAAVERLGLAKK